MTLHSKPLQTCIIKSVFFKEKSHPPTGHKIVSSFESWKLGPSFTLCVSKCRQKWSNVILLVFKQKWMLEISASAIPVSQTKVILL